MGKSEPVEAEKKRTSVNEAIAKIKKKWELPDNSMVLTTADKIDPPDRISTGLITLDKALDGGFPRGRFNVVVGPEASGKSTMILRLIAQVQKQELVPILIDAEGRFNRDWAARQGVDVSTLAVISPDKGTTAEGILDIYRGLADEKAADLIVIDSISALSPAEEKNKSMADSTMAIVARVLSKFFRVSAGVNKAGNVCGIMVAQPRSTLSQYETKISRLAGGQALKSYCDYIVYVSRITPKDKHNIDRSEGFIMTLDMIKCTGSHSNDELEYEFFNDIGIDPAGDLVKYAITKGMIEYGNGGVWTIKSNGEKGRGYANLVGRVSGDTELQEILKG